MLNKVHLIGRLGKDPESIFMDSGTQIVNFTLATSKKYKNKAGEKVDDTQWHKCVCSNKSAELAEQYLKKCSLIYVEGEIKYRDYEDKEGIKRYITEIYISNFRFLDLKNESSEQSKQQKAQQQESVPHNNSDGADDLPF